MLKGLGDLGNIMKLQKEVKNLQKRLKRTETEGESHDGSVKAIVNGDFKLIDLKINPELLKSPDTEKLEKLIISAINTAIERNKEFASREMSRLTGGLNIPGLSDFLK